MPKLAREPTFLPLTIAASCEQENAIVVRRKAALADRAAADCWLALIGGCSAYSQHLINRLRDLSDETLSYAGLAGSSKDKDLDLTPTTTHTPIGKLTEAEDRIDDAVRESDGVEFPEALLSYDQAVAAIVVRMQRRSKDLIS
jgi:hypothetical protein